MAFHQYPDRVAPRIRLLAGFTLVELLVVLGIAAILASLAIPAYSSFVMKGRRADAINALHAVVQAQERYRSNASSYASELAALNLNAELSRHYDIALSRLGVRSFAVGYIVTATAKPQAPQYADLDCRSMSIAIDGGKLLYDATRSDSNPNLACWPQ